MLSNKESSNALRKPKENIWDEYAKLTSDYNPVDLGMGYPDFDPPQHITDALSEIVKQDSSSLHQLTRGYGHPRLVQALSQLYSPLVRRTIDPYGEILVSAGAFGALYCAITAHIGDGDEVIVIEPFYECYENMIRNSGGIPKFISLKTKDASAIHQSKYWYLDNEELTGLFNSKTKAFILNNPHSPIGKVFTRFELQCISELCLKWDVLCISDEVYEWLAYKPSRHIRMACLPGMWERTITIGSAGQSFSVTGWRIGWAYGPSHLMGNVQLVHSNTMHCTNTPLQESVARGIEFELARFDTAHSYFTFFANEMKKKRDFMVRFLKDVGIKPVVPDGGYFVIANWTSLESRADLNSETDRYKDVRFTKWMTKNIGVQGFPVTIFCSEGNTSFYEKFVRFCFIKKDIKLKQAAERLQKLNLENQKMLYFRNSIARSAEY